MTGDMESWEKILAAKILEIASIEDPAHDLSHFRRVAKTAKQLCREEGADDSIVIPAAWLHDFVIVPKDDPRRSMASRLSAAAATEFLKSIDYPASKLAAISHAIECHSFSANIAAETTEAKIVQDADRLDGLGAIGIARCFATAGLMKRAFYSSDDAFCTHRVPNDQLYTVDHFYQKLFKTAETLQTAAGRQEGLRRLEVMNKFLNDFAAEVG